MPSTSPSRSAAWKAAFLDNLAETGLVSRAARYAGVTRQTAYNARNSKNRIGADLIEAESFAKMWDEAIQQAAASIELETRKRAMEGIERQQDIYYRGKKVGERVSHQYSDRLLMFLLQKLRPETYGEHAHSPCKHCGADPRTEPTPQEKASQATLSLLTAQLIAYVKHTATKPTPQQPSATPQPQLESISGVPQSEPVIAESPNPPASVSTIVSSFPETITLNSGTENSYAFVSNDVSSSQNFDNESGVEYQLSNADVSYPVEDVDCNVGAQHAAPLPATSNCLVNLDSPNPPLFASSDVSSATEPNLSEHFPFDISHSSFLFQPTFVSTTVSSFTESIPTNCFSVGFINSPFVINYSTSPPSQMVI
jgi:hypothetical protein